MRKMLNRSNVDEWNKIVFNPFRSTKARRWLFPDSHYGYVLHWVGKLSLDTDDIKNP